MNTIQSNNQNLYIYSYLPDNIINIILAYLSGLTNKKWKPVLNEITGKLYWKVNNFNKATIKIEECLKFKLEHPPQLIPLLCGHLSCDALIMCIKNKGIQKYLLHYERNGYEEDAIISINDYITNSGLKLKSYLFREYLPEPSFWISEIKDFIWNDYGITFILNDQIDGWPGEWIFTNNEWRFIINLDEEYLHQNWNHWNINLDNWDDWEDPFDNDNDNDTDYEEYDDNDDP
jgi:hypothetical protein